MHVKQFQRHRVYLFGLAYRMLGSATEAEDILQDAYLRVADRPGETIRHPRTYLTTVVTRLCLNYLATARVQREQYLGPWLPEPILTANSASQLDPAIRTMTHDSLSLAFLILLESLTPPERAVFLLREVFEYPYAEIASMLDRREAACRQLFRRAKAHIVANRPRFDTSPEARERLLTSFIASVEEGAIEEFLQLLADDVALVPDGGGQRGAAIQVLTGRSAVVAFINGSRRLAPPDLRYRIVTLNGELSILAETADRRPFLAVFLQARLGRVQLLHVIGGRKLQGLMAFDRTVDAG